MDPVDFDSVLNQSSTTPSFGSSDIFPTLVHGAMPGRIHTQFDDENDKDFTKGTYRRKLNRTCPRNFADVSNFVGL